MNEKPEQLEAVNNILQHRCKPLMGVKFDRDSRMIEISTCAHLHLSAVRESMRDTNDYRPHHAPLFELAKEYSRPESASAFYAMLYLSRNIWLMKPAFTKTVAYVQELAIRKIDAAEEKQHNGLFPFEEIGLQFATGALAAAAGKLSRTGLWAHAQQHDIL